MCYSPVLKLRLANSVTVAGCSTYSGVPGDLVRRESEIESREEGQTRPQIAPDWSAGGGCNYCLNPYWVAKVFAEAGGKKCRTTILCIVQVPPLPVAYSRPSLVALTLIKTWKDDVTGSVMCRGEYRSTPW